MFSIRQKRQIAEAVQKVLRDTKHPELPEGEIAFALHVAGKERWSWADIQNNDNVTKPSINPHNEMQDNKKPTLREIDKHVETMANPGEIQSIHILRLRVIKDILDVDLHDAMKYLREIKSKEG